MKIRILLGAASIFLSAPYFLLGVQILPPVYAQEQAPTSQSTAPEPLSSDEMEILVARIALYPDELVAAIVAASLYPVQIVQAQRYLEQVKTKPELKPDKDWDGSVISLLNYPDIIKMMSDDLDWTEQLGNVIANQEKNMLEAIQQSRDRAVAKGIIKSDDKTIVVQEQDRVVIQPAKANQIYVPVYEPQMLYEPDYPPAPVSYYSQPYPSYYYPTAPYFAGALTGAFWAAAIDWNDWGVWGGNGNWGDVEIGCNNCFNDRNFNGKVNWNDVDWSKVDRSKISFDKSQLANLDRNKIKDSLKANGRNDLRNRAGELNRNRPSTMPAKGDRQVRDVRKSTLEGLKNKPGNKSARAADRAGKVSQGSGNRGNANNKPANRPSGGQAKRSAGKPKAGARQDARPRNPSPMGDITRGRDARSYSNQGARSMGGGMYGGRPQQFRPPSRGGHGGYGGGGRGGYGGGGRSFGGGGGRGGGRGRR